MTLILDWIGNSHALPSTSCKPMRRSWPLSTNPEFSVLECPGYFEYRVENWRLARDGSGRTITRISSLSWLDAILTAALSLTWLKVSSVRLSLLLVSQRWQARDTWLAPTVVVILFYIWWRCNQVLSGKIDDISGVCKGLCICIFFDRIHRRTPIPRGPARDSSRFSSLLSPYVY